MPHPRFVGKSGCGLRGDAIEELDWCVGEVLAALDRAGLAEKTLVIFISDNGPVVDDGYADGAVHGPERPHPRGAVPRREVQPLRGGHARPLPRALAGEGQAGGVRRPGLPGRPAGVVRLAPRPRPAGRRRPRQPERARPRSGASRRHGRDELVEQGAGLSLRKGPWKLVAPGPANPAGAGKAATPKKKNAGPAELYDLADDPGEAKNLAAQRPEVVKEMTERLGRIRQEGRTRPAR